MELVGIIRPYVNAGDNNQSIPLELKVLCALSFYDSGSYQRILGRIADISFCQTSVCRVIEEITEALNTEDLLLRFIHFPSTRQERERVMARNEQLGMLRVLGFVDGTYVKIAPPNLYNNREAYFCRKGYTALNVQIVCDADLYIMDVNSGYPGSCTDPFIYRYGGVRDEMQRANRESRCWLLGDSIYPQEPWLHTPLPGSPEYLYTLLHCHCRNASERCNGVLKGRWRCLLWDRTLHYDPVKAGRIVNACSVLHNFCTLHRLPNPDPAVGFDPREGDVDGGEEAAVDDEDQERGALRIMLL